MAKIRIAIVGAGNCASSLIQGIEFYRRAEGHDAIPGLMHLELGGYHVGDIDCVAAFDVAKGKVGRDLADALQAPPNNTIRFADLRPTGVEVRRGPTHDGIGQYLRDVIEESPAAPDNVAKTLRAAGAEIVGVSRDTVLEQRQFKQKYDFPFRLLADTDSKLCDAFGVIVEKNMYGKKSVGIQRSTFLFEESGKIIHAWPKVSVEGHADEVVSRIPARVG